MPDLELVIVGGGPAGLTAGLYAARSRLKVELLERLSPGGQILNTEYLENWPGEREPVSGADLAERFRDHALRFGLTITLAEVTSLRNDGAWKILDTTAGEYRARSVILALGAGPKKAGLPGEEKFFGKGVSYCATCDAPFYLDKTVALIGGGNTAAEEVLYLARFAKKVYMIHRRDKLRSAASLTEKVLACPNVELLWNSAAQAIEGQTGQGVSGIRVLDLKTRRERGLAVEGIFIFVGGVPHTAFLPSEIEKDSAGYIITNQAMATSMPGVFAAGDCRASLCAK